MKLLAIGAKSDTIHNIYSGQSIMFDGLIDKLSSEAEDLIVVDISPRFKSNSVIMRSLDYIIILSKLIGHLLVSHFSLCYITTSQSKKGFIRDWVIINLMKKFKIKVVAHQYGANYNQLLDSLDENGKKKLVKMLDYVSVIIVEGVYMKNQYSFIQNHVEKVCVIPNGLPTVGKNAMRPKTYSGELPFKMFYLSNLIWTKGYFDVLKAVDLLINKYGKKVECVFAGKFMASADDENQVINNKDKFVQFVKEHHLESVVSYYPGMYGDLKDETFAASNVFLLPTYYINEGQPVSIIEAMSYGSVPIVTEYRHIPMMVTKENGCFVKPKDPKQIAEVVVWLMDHPVEYAAKSSACIKDYLEKFTFEQYASQVLKCMNEVVNS